MGLGAQRTNQKTVWKRKWMRRSSVVNVEMQCVAPHLQNGCSNRIKVSEMYRRTVWLISQPDVFYFQAIYNEVSIIKQKHILRIITVIITLHPYKLKILNNIPDPQWIVAKLQKERKQPQREGKVFCFCEYKSMPQADALFCALSAAGLIAFHVNEYCVPLFKQ